MRTRSIIAAIHTTFKSNCEIDQRLKNLKLDDIRTWHVLCVYHGVVLYQLSCQANWELVTLFIKGMSKSTNRKWYTRGCEWGKVLIIDKMRNKIPTSEKKKQLRFTDNRQWSKILTDNRQSNEILTDNRHVDPPPPPHSDPLTTTTL